MKENLTTEQKVQLLRQFLNTARLVGVAKTQKDFANFIGINEQTICKALKGEKEYLTEKLFIRIENAFKNNGISLDNIGGSINIQAGTDLTNIQHAMPAPNQPPTDTPTPPTYDRLLDEMKAQREMHDRMMSELLKQNSQLINIITNSKN